MALREFLFRLALMVQIIQEMAVAQAVREEVCLVRAVMAVPA